MQISASCQPCKAPLSQWKNTPRGLKPHANKSVAQANISEAHAYVNVEYI